MKTRASSSDALVRITTSVERYAESTSRFIGYVNGRVVSKDGEQRVFSLGERLRDFDPDYEKTTRSEPFSRQVAAISENRCTCFHRCYQTVNILFLPGLLTRAFFRRKR